MKRWQIGATAVGIIVLVVIFSLATSGPKGEKVYAEPAARHDIESVVSAPGEIDPRVKVNISAHVIGKIERLYFKEGDIVSRGQRLVDLEKVAFVAARDRALADLANRRIEVRRSQTNLANAGLQYRRAKSLLDQGIQAQELFDRARLDYDNAKSSLESAREGVRLAEATVAQANDDLSRTTILSPIGGRVVQLSAQEGEVVVTGTMNNPGSVIAVIADLSEILVQADVAETEVVKVRIGQKAKVKVDAVPDKEYQGSVAEIGSSATTRAGSTGLRFFTVKIALQNADERLRPGMTSQVDIVTDSARNALTVPVQSVVERSPEELKKKATPAKANGAGETKAKYVFVIRKGKAKAVPVKTGISDSTRVAIVSGLNGSEKVVTGPFRTLRSLKDGQPVQEEKEPVKKDEKSDES